MNKLIYLCTTIALSFSTNADAQLKRLEYMLIGDLNGSGQIWDSTAFEYDNTNQGFIERNIPDVQVRELYDYKPDFDMDMTLEDDIYLFPYSFTEFKMCSKYFNNNGSLEVGFVLENNWTSATEMESKALDENGDIHSFLHFTYDASGNTTKIIEYDSNNGTIGDTGEIFSYSYLNGNLIKIKNDYYQNNQVSFSWEFNFEYDNSNLVMIERLNSTNSGWRRRAYFDGSFMDSLLVFDVNNNIENIKSRHLFTNNGLRYDSYNLFGIDNGNSIHYNNYHFYGNGSRIDSVYSGFDKDPNSFRISYYTYDGNYVTDAFEGTYSNGQYSARDHYLHYEYSDILDIQEQDMERTISVFPNPTTDILSFDKTLEGEFTVVNMNGQVLIKGTLSNSQINVGHLPAGTFILKVNAGKENYTSRFIKE